MSTFKLRELRERAMRLADFETGNSTSHIDKQEWNDYVNEGWRFAYEKLTSAGFEPYESTSTITTDGSDFYTLPTDFYRMLAVIGVSGTGVNSEWNLIPVSIRDIARYASTVANPASRYRVVDTTKIYLYPKPGSGDEYRMHYIPEPSKLKDDNDTITFDGTLAVDNLVVRFAALQARLKEEAPVRDLQVEIRDIIENLQQESTNRVLDVMPFPSSERQDDTLFERGRSWNWWR